MIRCCNCLLLLAALTTLVLPVGALALPSDSEQEINFQADRFNWDDVRKTLTYSGSVEMVQGSLKILADTVVIFRDGNRVSRIVATGQPARYTQIAQPGEDPIVAEARRMEYNVHNKTLHLIDEASIVQKGTSLTGKRIDYDVKRAQVKAEGSGQEGETNRRVRMVIPPDQAEPKVEQQTEQKDQQ